jgi:hypothetical protein
MLMTADVACSPARIPSITAPTPAEEAALAACGQQIAAALAATLRESGTASCACSVSGWSLLDPSSTAPAGDELGLWWGESAPDWQLWLTLDASEDILASLLGCPSLQGTYRLSDTDRALLNLQCQKFGQQLSQRLGLSAPAQHGLLSAASGTPLPPAPLAQFALNLMLHGRTHPARLLVSLDLLRPLLPSARPLSKALDRALVAGAEVTLEAVLRGPILTAGQLLGLEPGDIVCLGQRGQDALLQVEGVTIGTGRPGAQAGRLAVNINTISTFPEGTHHGS